MCTRPTRGRRPGRAPTWAAALAVLAGAAWSYGFEPQRPFPDTTDGIYVFVDQLNIAGMSVPQMQFAASHYVGTQKQVSRRIDDLRVYNPDFIMIQYRLGTRESGYLTGPSFIHNDTWSNDWATINPNEDWFIHDDQGNRVYQEYRSQQDPDKVVKEYCMDVSGLIEGDTTYGWKEYWCDAVLADLDASHADGVFADSTHLPYAVPADLQDSPIGGPPHTPLIRHLEIFYDYVYQRFNEADRYFIPNIGGLCTTVDTTNGYYEDVHGAMVEGFAEKRWGLGDWKMQSNRILRLIGNGKIYIAQNGPDDGWSDMKDRSWLVGNFLLLKGSKSYLNMLGASSQLHWWPEYDIDIGAPSSATVPTNVDQLRDPATGLYRRQFQHGLALLNAGDTARTWTPTPGVANVLITPYGGGTILAGGSIERATGLIYTFQGTPLSLEGWSGKVLVQTVLGDANFDWQVGIADLAALAENYGQQGTWTEGDFNGDGTVGIADLSALADHYGETAGATVPEPATLVLMGIGAAWVVRRRR